MFLNKNTYDVIMEIDASVHIRNQWWEIPDDVEVIATYKEDFILFFKEEKHKYQLFDVFDYDNVDKLNSVWKGIEGQYNTLKAYYDVNVVWDKEDHGFNNDTLQVEDIDLDVVNKDIKFNPLIPQEGGDHYKFRPIQPIEYSERNGLSMCQGNIIKYITRHKEKNKVEDLSKVVHYCLLEAFFVYGEDSSTELKNKILKLLGENK